MKLDHLGVAVTDLQQALKSYEALGLLPDRIETVDSDQVQVAFLPFDGGRLELLWPTDANSPVQTFIDKRGTGLHHVALAVDNIRETLAHLSDAGTDLIDRVPRRGAHGAQVAFIHPKAMGGVLVELVEHPKDETGDHGEL